MSVRSGGCGVNCAANICSLFRVKRLGVLGGTGRRYSCLVINIDASRLIRDCGRGAPVVPFGREFTVVRTLHYISLIVPRVAVSGVVT